jgi:DNA-binding transcriptional regulator YiaG
MLRGRARFTNHKLERSQIMGKQCKPAEPAVSREAAGHTVLEAAALLDVSYGTWQDWEQGVDPMSPMLLKLYRHLADLERIPFRSIE